MSPATRDIMLVRDARKSIRKVYTITYQVIQEILFNDGLFELF